jgi:hypothetical protein
MPQIALLLLILTCSAFSQRILSGNIGGMTFAATDTPYIVTDNITIEKGQTTVIKDGCVFLFKPFTGIIVNGNLKVEGDIISPVVFTSINDSKYNPKSDLVANPFDWNGILIEAKSGAVSFSNIVIKYSVYGIKSQKEELTLDNARFLYNGQFHFTVDEKIMPVSEELPYNYGIKEDSKKEVQKKNGSTHRKNAKIIIRILSGTVALTGLGTGLYLNNQVNKSATDRTNIYNEYIKSAGGITLNDYNTQTKEIDNKAKKDTFIRNISYAGAAIGAVGFTLTFIF